jgi:hypothetical protein
VVADFAGGAVAGATASAAVQLLSRGRVDWTRVAEGAMVGGATAAAFGTLTRSRRGIVEPEPARIGPSNTLAAAEAEAGGGTTSIFRAVSSGEADDIAAYGFRARLDGHSFEGKLFATSAEDAARFGRINYDLDKLPFHIVEARVPTSFVDQLYTGTADRMTFHGVNPVQLAELNQLARTSIWDDVPWVSKR